MQERSQSRLASFITLLVGIWVAISPIWLSVTGFALASTIIIGCIIGILGIIQYSWTNVVPSWIAGIAAIWLFISMLVYVSTVSGGMMLSGILSAIAVFILAIWDGAEVTQVQHHHPATM